MRRKKNVKKGIQFCLMVCGASGTGESRFLHIAADFTLTSCTGRTTFVNTLCGRTVLTKDHDNEFADAHLENGVRIKPLTVGMLHGEPPTLDQPC